MDVCLRPADDVCSHPQVLDPGVAKGARHAGVVSLRGEGRPSRLVHGIGGVGYFLIFIGAAQEQPGDGAVLNFLVRGVFKSRNRLERRADGLFHRGGDSRGFAFMVLPLGGDGDGDKLAHIFLVHGNGKLIRVRAGDDRALAILSVADRPCVVQPRLLKLRHNVVNVGGKHRAQTDLAVSIGIDGYTALNGTLDGNRAGGGDITGLIAHGNGNHTGRNGGDHAIADRGYSGVVRFPHQQFRGIYRGHLGPQGNGMVGIVLIDVDGVGLALPKGQGCNGLRVQILQQGDDSGQLHIRPVSVRVRNRRANSGSTQSQLSCSVQIYGKSLRSRRVLCGG